MSCILGGCLFVNANIMHINKSNPPNCKAQFNYSNDNYGFEVLYLTYNYTIFFFILSDSSI